MADYQPPLFDEPPQRRTKYREPKRYYNAVMELRRAGYTVHRAGRRMSLVDGKLFGINAVLRLAKHVRITGGKA